MADANVRSDSVNVERIMEQVRSRIRDKRGVPDSERQIQELAHVRLEKILEPHSIRPDLLERLQKLQATSQAPEVTAEAIRTSQLFDSGGALTRFIRRLLRPVLTLFINPKPLVQGLQNGPRDLLFFELIHNLAVENARLGGEVNDLKMKVESLTGRLEFNERRVRALEGIVVYKPSGEEPATPSPRPSPAPARSDHYRPSAQAFGGGTTSPSTGGSGPSTAAAGSTGERAPQTGAPFVQGEGTGQRSRRRRRRRGRRSGGAPGLPSGQAAPPSAGQPNPPSHSGAELAPSPDVPRVEATAERASELQPHAPAPDSESGGDEPDSQ